jgi:hypothetical protein
VYHGDVSEQWEYTTTGERVGAKGFKSGEDALTVMAQAGWELVTVIHSDIRGGQALGKTLYWKRRRR